MLYVDVAKACNNKGIDNVRDWLRKNGFSNVIAYRLVHRTYVSINLKVLEQLCVRLHCTPNEFFSWQPGDNTVAANHPMQKLKPVATEHSINARLKVLPPEKLEALQQFLDKLDEE